MIATLWLRLHLSLRGRVMIANALMMSITRYAVHFLDIPMTTLEELKKEYYRLIWDDKSSGTIKDLHTCCKLSDGGIECFDLNTIVNAASGNSGGKDVHRAQATLGLASERGYSKLSREVAGTEGGGDFPLTTMVWFQA